MSRWIVHLPPKIRQQTLSVSAFLILKLMDYRDKYIKILEEENAFLKQKNVELEAQLKDTRNDLLTAIDKWDEAVNKLHTEQIRRINEVYGKTTKEVC